MKLSSPKFSQDFILFFFELRIVDIQEEIARQLHSHSLFNFNLLSFNLLQILCLDELHRIEILSDLSINLKFGADYHVGLGKKHDDHVYDEPVCLVGAIMEVLRVLIHHKFDDVPKQDAVKEHLDIVQKGLSGSSFHPVDANLPIF